VSIAGTLVARIGYRGAGFSGFAEQPGQRTVARDLRIAFETCLRRSVDITCAGRTDAGVHAVAQYVSVPVTDPELALPGRRLTSSLVALTPDDISIKALYKARAGFSARSDALVRRYRYRICCGYERPIMAWDHAWWLKTVPALDIGAMNEAASLLVGEHDFCSFCKAASASMARAEGRSTSRLIAGIRIFPLREAGEDLVGIDVCGNAFLHNMVRIIVGSLVEVGRGHRSPAWLGDALAAHNRTAAGPTAPPQGLTFDGVDYASGTLSPWE
jgi:tRNA pseudouridine38-40 synthase